MKLMEKIACTHQGESLCTLGTVTILAQGEDDEEDAEFWDYLNQGGGGGSSSDGLSCSRSIGSTATGLKTRKSLTSKLKEFKPKIFVVPGEPRDPLEQVGLGEIIKKAMLKKPMGFFNRSSSSSSTLDEDKVYLIDTGWKIFVWIGKEADAGEKVAALGAADRYSEIEPRANELPVTVLKSGQERDGFASFFK